MQRTSPICVVALTVAAQVALALPPSNDSCTNATPVGNGQVSGDTSGATQDGRSSCTREPATVAGDVWFLYTPPETGRMTFDTTGSDFYTLVSLHSGCPGSPSNELACSNKGFGGGPAVLAYDVTAGERLLIRVSGSSGTNSGPFVLDVEPAGSFSGRVIDAVALTPIAATTVNVFNPSGDWSTVHSGLTGVNGTYRVDDLPPGSYYVTTSNPRSYLDEIWNDEPCVFGWSCYKALAGTPVTVTGVEVTTGVNFALEVGGSISGRVTDAGTGQPLESARVIYQDRDGWILGWTLSDAAGRYSTTGLLTGPVRLWTSKAVDYVPELYEDVACPLYCDFTKATWIDVTYGLDTGGVDVDLALGGHITGAVTDEETGEGNVEGFIHLYDAGGEYVGGTSSKFPYTFQSLPAGTYYALVRPYWEYQAELYQDIPCPWGCDVTAGDPIVVVAGHTATVDFALSRGRNVSGYVADEGTGQPLGNGSVEIYDSSGSFLGSTTVNSWGFEFQGVPYGTHYVRTRAGGYMDELFDDLPCSPSCDVTTGTPVVVSSSTYPFLRFDLRSSALFADEFEDGDVSAWIGTGDPP